MQRSMTVLALLAVSLVGVRSDALTIHRSFRTREVGSAAGIGIGVPVDARVAKALDEGRAKEASREKVMFGRVTRVIDGRSFRFLTEGGSVALVRLEGVEVPADDVERRRSMESALKKLVWGRLLRVAYRTTDEDGLVLAQVTCGKQSINARLIEKFSESTVP